MISSLKVKQFRETVTIVRLPATGKSYPVNFKAALSGFGPLITWPSSPELEPQLVDTLRGAT
jgi:hypothetical protein